MLVDLTLLVTPNMMVDAQGREKKALTGHLGTHFDVMNKEFPLEYVERDGVVFDVRGVRGADIEANDIDMAQVASGMFIAFHTGFLGEVGYGSEPYFKEHPQISEELMQLLVAKGVSIIAIDCAGIRRGTGHVPADQYCADHNVFVVENVCNLEVVLASNAFANFTACTYPVNFGGMTGLPCRVVAKV